MSSYQNPPEDPFASNTGDSAPPPHMKEDIPNAKASMILGICSLVAVVVCCFTGLVGLVLGIIGFVMATKGEKLLQAEPDRWTGTSQSNLKTGKITSLIGLIVNGLGVVWTIISMIINGAVGMSQYMDMF